MVSHFVMNNQIRRSGEIIFAAAGLSIYATAVSFFFLHFESVIFCDILKGLNEPSSGILTCTSVATATMSMSLLIQTLSLFLFALPAVWSGYKLSGPGRLIVAFQLFVLGVCAEVMIWKYLNVSGLPMSLALLIGEAAFVGRLIRKQYDERALFESKTIELELRNNELKESRLAMVKQDESERRLLAADLHDQVLNDLRIVFQKFEIYSSAPNVDRRDEISALMKQSMTDVREIMDDLCPIILSEFGLPAAIEDRMDKAAQSAKLNVRFSNLIESADLDLLSAVEQQLIYRLVQESITNVRKHAEATTLRIGMVRDDNQLVVRVMDNGKGIDSSKTSETSRGLVYMRLRAALIGAKISWQAAPGGNGTTVEIRINAPDAPLAPLQETPRIMPNEIQPINTVAYV